MRTLLDDVLQYARLQGGTPKPPQAVPLDRLMDEVRDALKFVPEGRRPEVDVSARVDGATAWVTVADNGIGIAADDMLRLFRPFQRQHLRRQYGAR